MIALIFYTLFSLIQAGIIDVYSQKDFSTEGNILSSAFITKDRIVICAEKDNQ